MIVGKLINNTITTTTTIPPNITDKIIRSQLELTKPMVDGTALERARGLQDKIGKLMHFTRRKDVVVQDNYLEGVRGALVIPRDELRSGIILYLHGGGYCCGTLEYAKGFAAVLCEGIPTGLVKCSGGRAKNHSPTGLRTV